MKDLFSDALTLATRTRLSFSVYAFSITPIGQCRGGRLSSVIKTKSPPKRSGCSVLFFGLIISVVKYFFDHCFQKSVMCLLTYLKRFSKHSSIMIHLTGSTTRGSCEIFQSIDKHSGCKWRGIFRNIRKLCEWQEFKVQPIWQIVVYESMEETSSRKECSFFA